MHLYSISQPKNCLLLDSRSGTCQRPEPRHFTFRRISVDGLGGDHLQGNRLRLCRGSPVGCWDPLSGFRSKYGNQSYTAIVSFSEIYVIYVLCEYICTIEVTTGGSHPPRSRFPPLPPLWGVKEAARASVALDTSSGEQSKNMTEIRQSWIGVSQSAHHGF